MFPKARWQDWVTFFLGLWLVLSPWILGYEDHEAATLNATIVGFAVTYLSLFELSLEQIAEEWINVAAGLWLLASPAVLGFGEIQSATLNAMTMGALVLVFSGMALGNDKRLARWWHDHIAGQ